MSRNPRYDPLFEPLAIGPVVARVRFYPVPHARGTGCGRPLTRAGLREVKAGGGWAVVCNGRDRPGRPFGAPLRPGAGRGAGERSVTTARVGERR